MKAIKVIAILGLLIVSCYISYFIGYSIGRTDGIRWCKNYFQVEGIIE